MSILGAGAAVVAIDVGGTDLKSALIDQQGVVHDLRRRPTWRDPNDEPRAIVAQVRSIVRELCEAHPDIKIEGVGVAVPGLVDDATGIGVFSANLGWMNAPFGELLAEACELPVWFGHDLRSAGRAEFELGAARGTRDAVVIAIGTGIAGALFMNGAAVTSDGMAGELGHTLADPNGEKCACGAVGCLETIASAGAIARRYNTRTGAGVRGAREVLEAAKHGDAVAQVTWDAAVTALAEHIARLAATIAPDTVVIGGGLSQAGDALFVPLIAQVDALLSFHRRPRIVAAELGEDAGVLGVALGARERVSA